MNPARSSPPLGFKVALALIALLVAFLICELGARAVFPRPPDDLREPQIVYLFDPEIGYVLAPSQQGWSNDGFMTVNSLGFRGPEVALPKPPGRFRVVLLGDSVTVGLGVADQETFAAQLAPELKRRLAGRDVDVVNLAVSGYNTAQEVALLKRNLERLEPDLVLVGFYVNDVQGSLDTPGSSTGGTRMQANAPQAGQILHMEASGANFWNRQLRRSRAIYLLGRVITRLGNRGEWGSSRFTAEQAMLQGQESPDIERGWVNVAKAFADLATLLGGRVPAAIVSLPCKEQVTHQYTGEKYEQRLRDISTRQHFFVIDPLPALAEGQAKAELFVPYDRNHLNPAGHLIAAQAIAAGLDANHALDSRTSSSSSDAASVGR
jgi:lysophospholipase L1-like esterase